MKIKFHAFEPIDFKNSLSELSIIHIPLIQIESDPNQPRKNFKKNALEELASSIKKYGVIQPIIVKQINTKKYIIIAGERRWRASCIAKLETIPAIVRVENQQENVAISLIENIQREELNPIELARAFQKLNQDHDLSHEVIATMMGKSRTTITNFMRLLNLSEEVQQLLIHNRLEMGHARSLLTLPLEQQSIFSQLIIEKNMTVRDTEKLVRKRKTLSKKKLTTDSSEINFLIQKLSSSLSTKVEININEKGNGKIVIYFSSLSEADELVSYFTNYIKYSKPKD